MSILAWSALGLLAGFIHGKFVDKSSDGIVLDLLLGLIGAIFGGFMFRIFETPGATALSFYGLLLAVAGSISLLAAYHGLHRRV